MTSKPSFAPIQAEKPERRLLHKDSLNLLLYIVSTYPGINTESLDRHLRSTTRYNTDSLELLLSFVLGTDLARHDDIQDRWYANDALTSNALDEFLLSKPFFKRTFKFISQRYSLEKAFPEEAIVITGKQITIRKRYIPYSMHPILHWLSELDFFDHSENAEEATIRPDYQSLFKAELSINGGKQYAMTAEEFEKLQRTREANGRAAEEFVLELERKKYWNHQLIHLIKRASLVDVGAGYDITSLMTSASTKVDKFIEVKSYSGALQFFLTSNEASKAEQYGPSYYLYLVDIRKVDNPDYTPIQIRDPHKELWNNKKWISNVELYKFKELSDQQP